MMKAHQCIVCGIETAQGAICALCTAGVTRMHDDLMKLLKMDNTRKPVKKLKIGGRKQIISLN